jgi:hypothetical protein
MFFRMIRTQTGDCGTLHAGVIYDASKDAKLAAEAKGYIKAGFAEALTAAQVKEISEAAADDGLAKAAEEAAKAEAEAEAKAAEEAAKAEAEAKAAEEAAKAKK